MASIADVSDNPWVQRHRSPDGRLILDLITGYDPRDIHESAEQARPRVYDAVTGAAVIDLWSTNCSCLIRWPGEGGLVLTFHKDVEVHIAADGGSWSTNQDAGLAFAPGARQRMLRDLVDQTPRMGWFSPSGPPRSWGERLKDLGAALFMMGGVVFIAWLLWTGSMTFMPRHGGINAWPVQCSGSLSFQMMRLDRDGALRAEGLGEAPLPPVAGEGQRYGNRDWTVVIDGRDVTVLPGGNWRKAFHCLAPRSARKGAD